MDYSKLARSLREYYKANILEKVEGMKYYYRFKGPALLAVYSRDEKGNPIEGYDIHSGHI